MESHKPDEPIIAELKRLQANTSGRRFWSWIFFLVITGVFLIAPLVASLVGDSNSELLQKRAKQDLVQQPSPTILAFDRVWNPGPLANAHQPWANDCRVCHSTGFGRVKDADCLTCHQTVGDHVTAKHPKIDGLNVTCASCHQDHNGAFSLAEQNKHFTQGNCSSCHSDLKTKMPETLTQNVSDFTKGHPTFRLQLALDPAQPTKLTRVRMEEGKVLQEPSNLKFPHNVHLTAEGVHSPKGIVKTTCASCHEPTLDKVGFKPVQFEKNCQSCHALKFEPTVSNREVPHGPVDAVLSTLREFYSYTKLNGLPMQTQPLTPLIQIGRPGEREPSAVSFTKRSGDDRAQASAAATELFEKTSCAICHEVQRVAGPGKPGTSGKDLPQWSIAPTPVAHTWMPQANFSHAAHLMQECSSCHEAKNSKKSAEVLMPAISGCKDCHAGTVPVAQRVSSDCGVCHNFHMNPDQQAVQKKSHPIPKQSSIQSSSYLFSSIGKSK